MSKFSSLTVMTAVFGAALAVSAYAADMAPKKGSEPASVSDSAPDQTGMEKKGKAGVSTMPSKGPASPNESKQGTGKGPAKGASKDDVKMGNPKTPSGVDESRTGQSTKDDGAKMYGKKKGMDKDGMAK